MTMTIMIMIITTVNKALHTRKEAHNKHRQGILHATLLSCRYINFDLKTTEEFMRSRFLLTHERYTSPNEQIHHFQIQPSFTTH